MRRWRQIIQKQFPIITAYWFFTLFGFPDRGMAEAVVPWAEGWSILNTRAADWEAEAGHGSLTQTAEQFTAFLIANASATWVLTTEPIWIDRFSEVRFRFRATGLINPPGRPLLQLNPGSTGPVTPGATNVENPFARAGSFAIPIPAGQLRDSQIHEIRCPVFPAVKTEQIDQIVLTLQTGNLPGVLEIFEFRFVDPQADRRPLLSFEKLSPLEEDEFVSSFEYLSLSSGNVSLSDIPGIDAALPRRIQCAGIPFQLSESNTVAMTPHRERDGVIVPVGKSCSEIFLLMAAPLAGSDGAFRYEPRRETALPDRLIVTKHYQDGTVEQSFPYNVNRSAYVVDATPVCCYKIPAQADKILDQITIEDHMSYGQVVLIAVTINPERTPAVPLPEEKFAPSLPIPVPLEESGRPILTIEENRRVIVENSQYQIRIDARQGGMIESMLHKAAQRFILLRPSPLFSVIWGGALIAPENIHFTGYKTSGEQLVLSYEIWGEDTLLRASVTLEAYGASTCALSLRVENPGVTPQSVRVLFPNLQGIQISESPENEFYLFPLKRAALGNKPVRLNGGHSGDFPLQFMDVFSPSAQTGLAVHTRDTRLVPKRFRYEKTETESKLGVEYGAFRPLELRPQQAFETPLTVLEFHRGDWRVPWRTYRDWCGKWYRPNPATREILKNVFICRRDYPIGGTGYLFDPSSNRYTFPRLIAESRKYLGGIDMIDISGWAYSERYGRVGEYERFELGGSDEIQRNAAEAREQKVATGLYLEGYLVDPRSGIGQAHGTEWSILNRKMEPMKWTGNEEMFFCPFVPAWQDWMAGTVARVAQQTGADAMYLDQFGIADPGKACYSTEHGHEIGAHPVLAEHAMIQRVRHALDEAGRPVALYTEQVPNDITSQYTDAAFDYSLWGTRDYASPAKLHLFRFTFPDFKVIQLFHPGIDPRAASEEDAKIAFFHGEALWLKGRAASWYSEECRAFIQKANRIFHEHQEAFTSRDVEPFIPTTMNGLFANRFSSEKEDLITLYNATWHTLRGVLLHWPAIEAKVIDLWGMEDYTYQALDQTTVIEGAVPPHGVGCLVISR
ncbi:MAG TPA: DUF6259 domain-containing protein [bacterium]|nr:DUF6259 domain-containing protein [bacterium]